MQERNKDIIDSTTIYIKIAKLERQLGDLLENARPELWASYQKWANGKIDTKALLKLIEDDGFETI